GRCPSPSTAPSSAAAATCRCVARRTPSPSLSRVQGMQAWILDESPGEYRFGETDTPAPGPGEVRVALKASALNHMDIWVTKGAPKPHTPHVPGADGAGVIEAI